MMSALPTQSNKGLSESMNEAIERLAARRLIVVTGKGGVGKSAMTAALGRVLSGMGRRTLVLEVDPRENLHQLLDVAPSGGEISTVDDHLWLQNLKPIQVVDWVVRRQVKVEMLVQRVLKSPVYHRFVEGAPGLREMAILGHALRLVRGDARGAPDIDTVILDAPATGHGIYLLTAARLYAEAIGDGPFSELAGEIADFASDPEATSVVMVTSAEEMPVQEALEMREDLEQKFNRGPDLLVVNSVYPPLPEDPENLESTFDDEQARLVGLWRRRRAVNERELARVRREWHGPAVQLPLLPMDRASALIQRLARMLSDAADLSASRHSGGSAEPPLTEMARSGREETSGEGSEHVH